MIMTTIFGAITMAFIYIMEEKQVSEDMDQNSFKEEVQEF
jgi:hypothetical protein